MSDWSLVTDVTTLFCWGQRQGCATRGECRPAACATPSRWARAAGALARSDRLARGQRVHGLGREALAADGPVAALDLVDHAPRDAAHVLALDADHRVGEPLGDLRLLLRREDALDEPDVDERHVLLLARLVRPRVHQPAV